MSGHRGRRAAARGATCSVLASVIHLSVKRLFRRPRPLSDGIRSVGPLTSSFPSGHTAADLSLIFGAAQELPVLLLPLSIGTLGSHWSRLRGRKHDPSDIVAASVIALAVNAAAWKLRPPAAATARCAPPELSKTDRAAAFAIVLTLHEFHRCCQRVMAVRIDGCYRLARSSFEAMAAHGSPSDPTGIQRRNRLLLWCLVPVGIVVMLVAVSLMIASSLGRSDAAPDAERASAAAARRLPPYWTVRAGQTYAEIAQRTGLSIDLLETFNPYTDPTVLLPGQRIKLRLNPPPPPPKPLGPRYWTVRTGQSFGSIAAKTGHRIATLQRLNPRLKPLTLQPGDRVRLRR